MCADTRDSSILRCFHDLDSELASTRRVLERYPSGKGEWRPHAKSRSLAELATHVADLPNRGTSIITTDGLDIATRSPVAPVDDRDALLARFDEGAEAVRQALASAGGADLDSQWSLHAGPRIIVQATRRDLLRRMMLSHMIHHRAQLGVYYRLLDVPVPGVYGPSADDAGVA